jgi:hypothetical protein
VETVVGPCIIVTGTPPKKASNQGVPENAH